MQRTRVALSLAWLGCACGAEPTEKPPEPPKVAKAPEIGTGDHKATSVYLTTIASRADKLSNPRDLAFNPRRPDELWILNTTTESVTIVHDASTNARKSEWRKDGYALHFMAVPAAISFGQDETTLGKPGTFATCGESRNTYDDQADADDFMGPTLWSSDLGVFARMNPNGLGSHLDMLHNSPLCMGIAHETANVYWAFGGLANALFRYDFRTDDGIGNDDHSDGEVRQYVTGEMKYVPGIPSHLAYRESEKALYVADTGHHRIARLDTTTGTPGAALRTKEPMKEARKYDGAALTELVPEGIVESPSGLEIRGDLVYVSDAATSNLYAFTFQGGVVNYLETGLPAGSLSGMAFGPDGKLYLVDMLGDRVLRVDPITP